MKAGIGAAELPEGGQVAGQVDGEAVLLVRQGGRDFAMTLQTPSLPQILETDSGVDPGYRHYPKRVTPGEPLELPGTVLKWYGLHADDRPVPAEVTGQVAIHEAATIFRMGYPMKKLALLASVLVVCGVGLSSAQAAAPSGSLLVNGSFEDPVIAGPFQLFSSIPGWQPTNSCGPGIEIDRNAFGAAAEGNQSIELNTTCVNGVSQVVATTPGASYSLAFAFAARPGTTAAQNRMDVRFDGSVVDQLGPQAPGAGLDWSLHQYEVTATGSSATLSFQGSDLTAADGAGTELDFVSLVPLVLRTGPFTDIPESLSLFEVACPSPSVCLGMGFDPTFSNTTLTVITNGIPGPTQLIPDFDLTRLTCVSPTACFAIGTNDVEGLLLPITNGVAGPLQAVPGTTVLYDIVCSSATSCVAVGTDFADSVPPGTAVVVPIANGIAGPPQPVPGAALLRHLSCPSATSCFAIGTTNDIKGVLVPITNGVAGPAQVVAGADYLNAIACPSPSTCVIAGGSFAGSHSVGGFVVAVTDGTAGPVQLISPNVEFFSIACTDASHCVAVGDGNDGSGGIVAIDDGVAGPYQAVPGTGLLVSVACSTSCVAVGSDSSFNFDAIVPISGGVPGSAQYAGGASGLWEIACGAGGCMAVGDDFPGSVGGFLAIRPAATPALSTLASPSVPAGGLISDSATLTGGYAPTGSVTFTLYGPGDATCSNALSSTTVPVGASGVSNSGKVKVGAAGTYNWVATYSGDLDNLPVRSACGSEPVVITAQTLTGRAYGLKANVSLLGLPLLNQPPTPDTGEIVTTLDSSTSVPCVATLSGPLMQAHALCASVTTTAFPAASTAVASVADLSLSVATLPQVTVGAVHSTSTTRCDGSTGAATIAYLKIGSTVVIATPTLVAPNTHVTVGAVSLVLNEQVPDPTGLTVNGIHLSVNGGGLAQTNLVAASARSGISNCP